MSRVEIATTKLEELIEEQQQIVQDAKIGLSRKEMFDRLKRIRNEFYDLVQVVSPY